MSKENNKKLLDSTINLNSIYLTKEIQRRLKQASFIFNLLGSNSPPLGANYSVVGHWFDTPLLAAGLFISNPTTLNFQLSNSQIKLFSEICIFLERNGNLDILASCANKISKWCYILCHL